MSKEKLNLNDIWNQIEFDKGTEKDGVILCSFTYDVIADYEIEDGILIVEVYSKFHHMDDDFEDIIDESISENLESIGLNEDSEFKVIYLKKG